jgi:hypothetical protein
MTASLDYERAHLSETLARLGIPKARGNILDVFLRNRLDGSCQINDIEREQLEKAGAPEEWLACKGCFIIPPEVFKDAQEHLEPELAQADE